MIIGNTSLLRLHDAVLYILAGGSSLRITLIKGRFVGRLFEGIVVPSAACYTLWLGIPWLGTELSGIAPGDCWMAT